MRHDSQIAGPTEKSMAAVATARALFAGRAPPKPSTTASESHHHHHHHPSSSSSSSSSSSTGAGAGTAADKVGVEYVGPMGDELESKAWRRKDDNYQIPGE
jgi:hypothetical protein